MLLCKYSSDILSASSQQSATQTTLNGLLRANVRNRSGYTVGLAPLYFKGKYQSSPHTYDIDAS
eukprot:6208567-Pleurochrysis_carterae.AAC.4